MANESTWQTLATQPDHAVWAILRDHLPMGHDWTPILQGRMLPRAHRLLKDHTRDLMAELANIPADATGAPGHRRRTIIAEIKLMHPRLERANYLMRGYRAVRHDEIQRDVSQRRYFMLRKLIQVIVEHRETVGDQPRPCDLVLWEVLNETWPSDAPATAPTLGEIYELRWAKNRHLLDELTQDGEEALDAEVGPSMAQPVIQAAPVTPVTQATPAAPVGRRCETCSRPLSGENQAVVKLGWIKYRKWLCEGDYHAYRPGEPSPEAG